MNALDLLRSVAGSDESMDDRAHRPHHAVLECEDLEPRQLLSTVQGATNSETTVNFVQGATAGATLMPGASAQSIGGASVVTHAVGDVNYLQSQVPLNDFLANFSQVITDVYAPATPISAARGLTSLPITPLLPPDVTSNETPLNNGTPDIGTVWITMPPITPGIFHMYITETPFPSNVWMQTVNPQGEIPTFTHFGQAANGSLNGAAINQPVAVGPVGPSITEEIEPVQPAPVEAHQQAGPPPMIQQDVTTESQNAQTPPGGQEGAGQLGTPGQGAAPGQPGTAANGSERSAGGETTQGIQATTPHVPAGQGAQGGGNQGQTGGAQGAAGGTIPGQTGGGSGGTGAQGPAGGAQGGTGGSRGDGGGGSGGGASLLPSERDATDPPVDLIDEAIPVLVANSLHHADDTEDAGALPTVFGAAAVAAGGFQLAVRNPDRPRRGLDGGPPDGDGPSRD